MNRDWKIVKGLHGNLSFSNQLIQVRIAKCFTPHTLSHKKKLFFVFSKIIENNVNLYQEKP